MRGKQIDGFLEADSDMEYLQFFALISTVRPFASTFAKTVY